MGGKGRAKSFITVITTCAHLLFHSAGGEEKRKEGEERLNVPTEVFTTHCEITSISDELTHTQTRKHTLTAGFP